MPFPSSLSVSDTSSSCVADLYSGQCTPRSDLCLCACSYGVKSFAGERLSRVPIKGCRKRSSPHPYSRPADSLSDSSAMQGFCRPHENLATARNGFSFDNSSESSCSGFVSSPSSGLNGHGKRANPLYGHGKESHHMQASCRQRGRVARFTCRSQSIDMGFSDTQTFQPAMWDQPCLPHLGDSFEDSIFLDSTISTPSDTYYIPLQPETIDPISQLACQHAMGKNMQWWRFLLYCRAQLGSPFSKRIKYSLVGKNYTRVLLPSRARAKVFVVPAFSIALKQEPLSMAVDHLTLVADEILGWFQQMGSRYGASLLCLLVLGYWIQGFRCFPWLAMSYHLKDGLQVDPAMLQFLQSTVNLPMVAKPVYGIISDAIYIGGARRMPYLMIAGVLQALSWSTIALHSGIRSSIAPLMGILLVSNVGAAIAEVVNDALVAEAVQKERGRAKGELQSFVWLALAIGGVLGNLTGGFALSRLSSTTMCAIFFTLVAGQFVVSALVKEKSFNFKVSRPFRSKKVEEKGKAVENVKQQAMKLMELVSRPEIARPLAWFAASYAVIPALAGSLFFYQTQNLKIHPTFLGLAKVMGQMGLLAGSLLYNRYLKKSSPRQILMALQILLSICMLSDVFLVTRLNITVGIPDQLYVLGASAFVEAIAQFKVLPFSVLLTQLCPAGSEGSLLAFFMSCHCLASILSGYTGTILASFLHLSADSFAGLPLGILIQSLAALIPLLWISCIPSCPNKQVVI